MTTFSIKKQEFSVAIILLGITISSAFAPFLLRGKNIFLDVIEDPNNLFSFYPWNLFSASLYHIGRFPLYNPFNGCGVPLLANLQSAPFYPLHILLFLCPALPVFDAFLILRLFLLGFGMYLFSRKIELSHQSAISAMLGAVFGGFFMRYRSMVHLNVELLLPWALWAVSRISMNHSWKNFVILTAIFTFSLLGGNAESAFFVFLCAVMWAIYIRFFEKYPNLVVIVGAATAAFLISTAQILPFLEYLPHTWHIHEAGAGTQWLDPRLSVGFLTPLLFDIKAGAPLYLGAVAVSLAIVGTVYNKKSLFFSFLSFFLLCLICGIPGFKWLTYLPVFNRIASYKYGLAPLTIAISLLTGFGIEAISKGIVSSRRYLRSAFAVFMFAFFFVLGAYVLQKPTNYAGIVLIASLLALASAFAFFNSLRPMLVSLLWIELMVYFFSTPARTLLNPSDIMNSPHLKYVSAGREEGRTASSLSAGFLPNLNLVIPVHEVGLFDALYPKNYIQIMSEALGFEVKEAERFFKEHAYQFPVHAASTSSPLWDELGVKFFLGRDLAITTKKEMATGLWENENAKPLVELDGASLPPIIGDFWSFSLPSDALTGALLFRYNYLPGWRCWVGKREVKIEKNSYGFMKVKVPSPAKITLRYLPWGFRIGLWTMLTTTLTIVLTLIIVYQKSNFLLTE